MKDIDNGALFENVDVSTQNRDGLDEGGGSDVFFWFIKLISECLDAEDADAMASVLVRVAEGRGAILPLFNYLIEDEVSSHD